MFKRRSNNAAFSTIVFAALSLLPSVVAAQAPGAPQQGAINTTKSTIENTSRVDSQIEDLKVELATRVGDHWSVRQVQTRNGRFELGVLPVGEYELRFSNADGQGEAAANRGITINTAHVEYSNQKAAGNADPKHNSNVGRLAVILTGVDSGTLKKELQGQLNSVAGELSRPGKTKFKNIVLFKADGRSQVKGMLKHDTSVPAIRNTR